MAPLEEQGESLLAPTQSQAAPADPAAFVAGFGSGGVDLAGGLTPDVVFALQRSAGNTLVTRLLRQQRERLAITRAPASGRLLQLAPGGGGIMDVLAAPTISDKVTGNAVEAAIKRRFPHKLVKVTFPDASSAPFRTDGKRDKIDPQIFGGLTGSGRPDLAARSQTGMAMLLAEIKPANAAGITLGEMQLANYIDKGNSPDNADLRRRLGVKVFAPMLPGFFSPPKRIVVGKRRFRALWAGPGVLLYQELGGKRKKKKEKKKQKKGQKGKQGSKTKKQAKPKPKRLPKGKGMFGNLGLGISIGSSSLGAANVGVGVAINSQGISVGTVNAGIVYDSQGIAVGSVGVGAAKSSSSAGAGTAGVGASSDSQSAGAGTAGVGTAKDSTSIGAGTAGVGSSKDATTVAVGKAGKGSAQGAGGSGRQGGGAGQSSGGGGHTGGQGGPAQGGTGSKSGTSPGPAGGTGKAAGDQKWAAEIAERLGLPKGATGPVTRVLVDAARLDALVRAATPAQKALLRVLAIDSPNGVYAIPQPAWLEMILEATKGLTATDLERLATLEWEPANTDLETLRDAIRQALQAAAGPKQTQTKDSGAQGQQGGQSQTGDVNVRLLSKPHVYLKLDAGNRRLVIDAAAIRSAKGKRVTTGDLRVEIQDVGVVPEFESATKQGFDVTIVCRVVEVLKGGKYRVGDRVQFSHSAGYMRATDQRYSITFAGSE